MSSWGEHLTFQSQTYPSIRWWLVLLLEKFPPRSVMEIQQRKRRRTDKPHKTVATVDQPLNIQELPPLVLREILLEVVLQDGDVAIGSLALMTSLGSDDFLGYCGDDGL
ncbi:hypothetical protein R3I94_004487 [Phoxinus phoxinus]